MEARSIGDQTSSVKIESGPFHRLGPGDSDPMRHVFGVDGSVYRGIDAASAETVQGLFDSGLADELVTAGLMTPSILVEPGIDGYPLTVEQPELTPPNLAAEMPPSMRRDTGLALIRMSRMLDRKGFALREADISGFVADRYGRPVFHHLAAILPKGSHKFPYAEFHANFLGPLRLIARRPELAGMVQRAATIGPGEDMLLRRPWLGGMLQQIARTGTSGRRLYDLFFRLVDLSPYGGLLHNGLYATFVRESIGEKRRRSRGGSEVEANWTRALLDAIERRLGAIDFDRVAQRWTEYHGNVDLVAAAGAGDNWKRHYEGAREQALIRVLSELPGGTLLDLGANGGYFSMLGAHLGFATTALDFDIGAIDKLYRILTDAGSELPVRPFVSNFVSLERQHWARFEADIVFALGFVHHLRLVEFLPWAVIAERLAGLTRKILVTEFKPGTGAGHAKQGKTGTVVRDYTLEHLVAALEKHFSSVELAGDFTAVGGTSRRTMLVCRR